MFMMPFIVQKTPNSDKMKIGLQKAQEKISKKQERRQNEVTDTGQ